MMETIDISDELLVMNSHVMLKVTRQCMTAHLLTKPHGLDKLHETVDRLLKTVDLAKKNEQVRTIPLTSKEYTAEIDFRVFFVIKELCNEYPELTAFFK